jgi:hypothetical protein
VGSQGKGSGRLCFVIMPFGDVFDLVWEYGIRQALSRSRGQWECWRADDIARSGDIVRQVLGHIERADVVLADLTGGNANVLYELGYAHAKGKPLVLVTQDRSKANFDVNHLRNQEYRATPTGLKALRQWIRQAVQAETHPPDPRWLSGRPEFSLEPYERVLLHVSFILQNVGDGVADDVHISWGHRGVAYTKALEPGYQSNVALPNEWDAEWDAHVASGAPLNGPFTVTYRDSRGHRLEQSWLVFAQVDPTGRRWADVRPSGGA